MFCNGSYPSVLIELWEEWDEENSSENDHPGELLSSGGRKLKGNWTLRKSLGKSAMAYAEIL